MNSHPIKKYSLINLYSLLNNWHSVDFEFFLDDPWIYLGESDPIDYTERHETDRHCGVDVEFCICENQLAELDRSWWGNPWGDYQKEIGQRKECRPNPTTDRCKSRFTSPR